MKPVLAHSMSCIAVLLAYGAGMLNQRLLAPASHPSASQLTDSLSTSPHPTAVGSTLDSPGSKPGPLTPDATGGRPEPDLEPLWVTLQNSSDPVLRHDLLQRMLSQTPGSGWPALAQRLVPGLKPFERQFLLAVWATRDAPRAARFVVDREAPDREAALQEVFGIWASNRPLELMEGLRSAPAESGDFSTSAVEAIAQADPSLAPDAILLAGPVSGALAATTVAATVPPEVVETILRRIPADRDWDEVRSACFASLAHAYTAARSPTETRAWAEQNVSNQAFQSAALPAIALSMPASSALTWLKALPLTPANLESIVLQVHDQWMEKDPLQASTWLAANPEFTLYDQTAAQVANSIAVDDPEAAAAWAASVHDAVQRRNLLDTLPLDTNALPE